MGRWGWGGGGEVGGGGAEYLRGTCRTERGINSSSLMASRSRPGFKASTGCDVCIGTVRLVTTYLKHTEKRHTSVNEGVKLCHFVLLKKKKKKNGFRTCLFEIIVTMITADKTRQLKPTRQTNKQDKRSIKQTR